jgi:uncharacterized lipoprotein YmbA
MNRPMKPFALLALAGLLVAGCAGTPPLRYAVPAIEITDRMSMRYSSLEILQVSLPRFASAEAILVQGDTGALVEDTSAVWADDPPRAITLELVRHIGTITGGKVASDPWPFREPAVARLEVRIEDLSANPGGELRLSGQYFVAPDSGSGDRSRRFALTENWQPEGGLQALAAARARIVARLAQEIVTNGLR